MKNIKYSLIDSNRLKRVCDHSFINNYGFTIPKKLYEFFNVENMKHGENRKIIVYFQDEVYQARFTKELNELGRIRFMWSTPLKQKLQAVKSQCSTYPTATIIKIEDLVYKFEMSDYVLVEDIIVEIQYEQNQNYDVTYNKIKNYTDEEIEKLYKERTKCKPKLRSSSSKRYATDPRLKATRNKMSNYQCEIDKNHKTFVSMSNENDYVECHHLIPMMAQDEFLSNENESQSIYLDSLFNLISLCPICHTQFHYGSNEEVEKIFWKAYELRKEELLAEGFTREKMEYILNKYYSHEFK